MRAKRGSNEVSDKRSKELTSTRFLCLVLMRDKFKQLFSQRKVEGKISGNLIALSMIDGYYISSINKSYLLFVLLFFHR